MPEPGSRRPHCRVARAACGARQVRALLTCIALAASSPALADAKAGAKKAELCLLCHKPDNRMAYVPTLQGQTREYLIAQLKSFKERRRPDTAMQNNVAGLSVHDMADIADYFAAQRPVRPHFTPEPEQIARGKEVAGALGCGGCHGAGYAGHKEAARLAGMEPRYLAIQLSLFAAGKRPHPAATQLQQISPADAEVLAQFFASLH